MHPRSARKCSLIPILLLCKLRSLLGLPFCTVTLSGTHLGVGQRCSDFQSARASLFLLPPVRRRRKAMTSTCVSARTM